MRTQDTEEKMETTAQKLIAAFLQFNRLRFTKFGSQDPCHEVKHRLRHNEVMLLFVTQELSEHHSRGVRVSDLSDRMRVKPPTITPSINNLEKERLIERSIDPDDRRIIRIRLTDQGREFIDVHRQFVISQLKGLVDYLGKEKSDTLADLLNEVFSYVQNHSDEQSHTENEP